MHDPENRSLNGEAQACKRPAFLLPEAIELTAETDLIVDARQTDAQLVLSGPSVKLDPLHRPVRGDLAHIALAGKVFVPHYAVPMPQTIATGGTTLRMAGRADAEAIIDLAAGETFNVLDMSGGWAWGQQGEHGFVGYVPLTALAAA